jgi:ribonuclease-3
MLSELEAGLGYTFRDKSILENALTHSSYANEHRAVCATTNGWNF